MCIQCIGMCGYCDCRNLPVISSLSCEHAEILKCSGAILGLAEAGGACGPLFDELLAMLAEHGAHEERTLFAELRCQDDTFVETLDRLCDEHRQMHRELRRLRREEARPEALRAAFESLRRHILSEEHGLFPPAAILLSPEALRHAETRAGTTVP
jgi:hypothetical protein